MACGSCVFVYCLIFSASGFFVNCADTNYLKSTIRDHFGKNRHHLVNRDYKSKAKQFIQDEFKRFGLDTQVQSFKGAGYPDINGRDFYNVIGVLKGARFGKANDKIIGIGAHYDTVRNTSGVDDNGAGVTAMLETVRQLTSQYKDFQNTIIFVAFDIEEYLFYADGIGSQHFVANWLFPWIQTNYHDFNNIKPYGVIVLDTMMNFNRTAKSQTVPGSPEAFAAAFPHTFQSIKSDNYRGDFLTVIFRAASDDIELASTMQTSWHKYVQPQYEIEPFALPLKTVDLNDKNFQDFLRSDHYHFWKQSLPAIFITDSANLRGVMVKCYHHECDNVTVMLTDENVQFLGQISDTMTHTIATLTGASIDTSDGSRQKMTWGLVAVLLAFLRLL